ncbi:MAG: ATP-binding protein [Candidatus Omnitrophica bacterium]|nr:ATP-binding protein [Candidatus Omnitrophota bacterium]
MIVPKIDEANGKGSLLRGFLHQTLKDLMSVTDATCGSFFLFDSCRNELVLDSFYNSAQLHIEGLRKRIGQGIAGKVVNSKSPILVKDIDKDLRFTRNGFSHYKTKSFISIPLFNSLGLVGVINLADKSSGEPFSEKDFELAVLLSKYSCMVIENLLHSTKLENEKEVLDRQKALLEKYASVGKLTAGVVHEINNPLDSVIRYANILITLLEGNSVAREYLLELKNGLNRIANITKSLLDFSHRVNRGSAQLKNYVSLNQLIEDSIDSLRNKINGSTHINRRYNVNLPKILDFGLSHVVTNIIKNALDAMPEGGTLEISADMHDSVLEIGFKDTGCGISEENKELIFEPFFTTKGLGKGSGLGLAICNEIINKYEGKIEVKSLPGEGSVFTVLIPQKNLEHVQSHKS